jgi:hypothetical protein
VVEQGVFGVELEEQGVIEKVIIQVLTQQVH